MNKKSKLLKISTRTATYLTAIAALLSFIEPTSAGRIREWNEDNNGHNLRKIQVVFGSANQGGVPRHVNAPDQFPEQFSKNDIRRYMRDRQPPINGATHIEFWISPDQGSQAGHIQHALSGANGARENAYISAFNQQPIVAPALAAQNPGQIVAPRNVVLPNVTFSLHVRNENPYVRHQH